MAQVVAQSKILIAEDLPALREPLAMALAQVGYDVRAAANGLEALREIEKRKPDLLLLDLAMPEMSGVECLREVRRVHSKSDLPVIILTAHSERSLVQEVLALGVSDFFLKSTFSLASLMEKVGKALGPRAAKPKNRGTESSGGSSVDASSRLDGRGTAGDSRGASPRGPTGSTESSATASIQPLVSRAEMEKRLRRINELKAFSPAILSLLQTIDSPSSSLDQIVESAGLDQALASRFLWLANSAAFSRGAQVTSLRKAIVRIGTEKLREAAVTIGILDRFGEGSSEVLHYGRFWEHSVTVACAAAELVKSSPRAQEIEPDVAFTMGLMHDIGRLMLLEELGDLYEEVIETARDRHIPLHQAEARLLLTTHAKVAQEPLLRWRFSSGLVRPIAFHHLSLPGVRELDTASRHATTILVLANTLAQSLILGDSGEDSIEDVQVLAEDLALDPDFLAQLQIRILESWRDLRTIVVMKSWRDWPDRISVLRNGIPDGLKPRFLEVGPSMMTTFFDRLLPSHPDKIVNAWILRAEDHSDVRHLLDQITAVEERISAPVPFPVAVIAPADFDMPYLEGRDTQILRGPFCVNHLIEALQSFGTAPKS